ncbi:MAG TPA: hypothetical protein VMB03_23180 [Bryobacteraceae bacterium]|nr:hypothetical protein [Bryobacteraceae bacterium]
MGQEEEPVTGASFATRLNQAAAIGGAALSDQSIGILEEFCREMGEQPPHVKIEPLQLNLDARRVLLQYSTRCAVEAVRKRCPGLVANGLAAVLIENGSLDIRDTIRVLAELFHSASVLQLNAIALFGRFADIARNEGLASSIRRFSLPAGSPSAALKHFGLRVSGTGDTFRYVDDDDLMRAVRMYRNAPGLTFSQRLMFIRMLLRQNREQWQLLKRDR